MFSYSILSCCSKLSRIHHLWCIDFRTLDFALPCALSYITKLHFPDWLLSRIEFISCTPFLQVFGQEKGNYCGYIIHSKNFSNLPQHLLFVSRKNHGKNHGQSNLLKFFFKNFFLNFNFNFLVRRIAKLRFSTFCKQIKRVISFKKKNWSRL